MKKSLKLFALLFSSSLVLAGCDDFEPNWPMEAPNIEDLVIDTPWTDYAVPVTSIALGKGESNLELKKGDTFTFSYTAEPRDAFLSNLVWESSNPSVATIENGVLTALAGGQTNISVSCGEVSAKSKVNVVVPIEDFEVKNKALDLDIEGEAQIEVDFSPIDTTQNKIKYELVEPGKVTVSDSGLVKALKNEGDAEIRVTNEVLNKVETVTVHVSDKWNYISEFTLSGPTSIEVSKSGQVEASVIGTDPSIPATTLRENTISYSVKEGSENKISVDAETGEFTALDVGNATIVASLFDGRATEDKDPETAEFTVNIFEVSATAISLGSDSHTTIELNNKDADKATYQLSYNYVIEDAYKDSYSVPSRGKPAFSSDDKDVATVSEDGLITFVGASKNPDAADPFETKIRITDPSYTYYDSVLDKNLPISDYVTVHNTVYAESISINGDDTFYLDETITLTAETNPTKVSENVVWEYDDSTGHTFVEDGNQLKITCNNLNQESIEVTARIGSNLQDSIELHPIERPVPFEDGKVYIVGSANYKTGASKPVEGGSWTKGKYAFIMSDPIGDDTYALYKFRATITFNKDDEWKIRENAEDWRTPEEDTDGEYENAGALANGQMFVAGEGGDKKIIVNQAGKYDIYYTKYSDYYKVYVEEHGLQVSTTEVHAKFTTSTTSPTSSMKASNWEGTLGVKDYDENDMHISFDSEGNIFITPKVFGERTFTVFDDYKEIGVRVLIAKESTAATTDFYIRGDAVGTWEVPNDYVLREHDTDQGAILDVYLNVGDFKIADENWTQEHTYGWGVVSGGAAACFSEGAQNSNIHCDVAGYYDIYLTDNGYIYIEHASSPVVALTLDKTSAVIEQDENVVVTATGLYGNLVANVTEGPANVAVDGNKATIIATGTGDATIAFSDSDGGDPVVFTLKVNDVSDKFTQLIETKNWFNSGASNEKVFVYAFDTSTGRINAPYPGEEASYWKDLTNDEDNKKLFSFAIKESFDTFIVTKVVDGNNTYKTVDITIADLEGDNCIYLEAQPEDVSKEVKIGHYQYEMGIDLSIPSASVGVGDEVKVTINNAFGSISHTESSGNVEVTMNGNEATISSDVAGSYTVSFSDQSGSDPAVFTFEVSAATKYYIETKSWFNSGTGDALYLYAYDSSDDTIRNANFPGIDVSSGYIKDIDESRKLFQFDVPEIYDTIILSKVVGGNPECQTQSISLADFGVNNCIYLIESEESTKPVGFYDVLSLTHHNTTDVTYGDSIASGDSIQLDIDSKFGLVDGDPVVSGEASLEIVGNVATISSSTPGSATITFTDTEGNVTVYTLTVTEHVHTYDEKTHLCTGCSALDPNYVKITFTCNYDTQDNGDIYIYGIYGWDAKDRIALNWTPGNIWTVELTLKVGEEIGFKAVRSYKGTSDVTWERDGEGNERKFTPTVSETYVINWGTY